MAKCQLLVDNQTNFFPIAWRNTYTDTIFIPFSELIVNNKESKSNLAKE